MITNSPLIIAHRGASVEAPENTLAAIQKAIELNVDGIEIDIYFSKEKIPVVLHDECPQRTTNISDSTAIDTLTLNEIKLLDAGSWFGQAYAREKIPTLAEVLQLKRGTIKLMIEIKTSAFPPAETIPHLLALINSLPLSQRESLIFGSFDLPILQELKAQAPELNIIGILEDLEMITEFKKIHINHFGICSTLITKDLIHSLHQEAAIVWTYTVDTEEMAKSFAAAGIDGIITNNPRFLKSFL